MTVNRWRKVPDVALVAGCLVLTAMAVKTPWSTLPVWVIAVAGTAGSLAQLARRRRPEVAAMLGAAAFALSGNPGPWAVGVYSGAVYLPLRRVWLAGLAGWAGLSAYQWIDAGQLRVGDLLAAAGGTALTVLVGVHLTTRRALLATLRERAEIAETQGRLRDDQARAAERDRIAREMHDLLAHKVSLIALHAGALELKVGKDPVRAKQTAGLIRVTARQALQELRTVLGMLHADALGYGESTADVASLVESSTRAGQPVDFHDGAGRLPAATARVVYRVVQEGLTNAHRHAPGAQITVSVEREDTGDSVTVVVRNGPSSPAKPTDLPGTGSGLVGLAERLRLVGGSIESGPVGRNGNGGWRVDAKVPWLQQDVDDES